MRSAGPRPGAGDVNLRIAGGQRGIIRDEGPAWIAKAQVLSLAIEVLYLFQQSRSESRRIA